MTKLSIPVSLISILLLPRGAIANGPSERAIGALEGLGARVVRNNAGNVVFVDLSTTVNPASDQDMKLLADIPTLEYAALRHTEVTDKGIAFLGRLPRISTVRAPEGMTDRGLARLAAIKTIEYLDLVGTKITDRGMRAFQGMIRLRWLSLAGTTVGNEGVSHLRDDTNLRHLDLWDTKVGDHGLRYLGELKKLETLMLPETVGDQGLAHLKNVRKLRCLYIEKSHITDASGKVLGQFKDLEVLCLYGTHVGDAIAEELGRLPHLRELNVGRTRFTRKGVSVLMKALPELELQWPE